MGRQQERELYARVIEILNRFDLAGVEAGQPDGFPADEYGPEARSIESVLVNRGSIQFADVQAVWLKQFSDNLDRLPPERAHELVSALNDARRAVSE